MTPHLTNEYDVVFKAICITSLKKPRPRTRNDQGDTCYQTELICHLFVKHVFRLLLFLLFFIFIQNI